ncbi:MAG: hypothetical protein MUF07_17370 [Steroidobacteraceae bacterium]|jgi:hypothetical protein|nr:hypothetical protein [Steroidobacteraceae bacterium]
MRRTAPRAAAMGALGLAAAAASASAADLAFTGYARDVETRRLLYVESHFVRDAGRPGETRVVMYRCANGSESFARKQLRYGEVREQPEFTFADARGGYTEGLRRTPRGPQVFQRDDARSAPRESRLPGNVVIVADAGFDEFVRRHWGELEAGRTVRFPFLVPSRLDFLTFKVRKDKEETIEGAAASVIRLNLSGVLGWFLPYIEVSYRKADQVLMRYKGITNIRDAAGDNLVAQIDFPSKERRVLPDGSAPLDAQEAAPLVARCSGG